MQGVSADYQKEHKRMLDRFKQFAPNYVCDVGVSEIQAFVNARLQSGLKPVTVNGELRDLKAALSEAVRLKYLRTNPVRETKMLRVSEATKRVLSKEECVKLLNACPNEVWRAFIYFALTTGMRRGELLALEWSDVDLIKGTVMVRNSEEHRTKSGKSRTTSTTREGCEMLTRLRLDCADAVKVFTHVPGKFSQRGVLRRFGKLVEAAGIPHCTLHDLRRTSLTILATKLPAFALQQRAGHASPSTTATYYIGDLAKEANRLAGEAFKGLSSGK
jgi:integrase